MIGADRRVRRGARAALAAAFACAALAGPVSPAHASPSRADALFEEGKALLEQQAFAAACPKLAESQRLEPGGGVALALALCREGEGKTAQALAAFREALTYARRDARRDREEVAAAKVAELEASVPRVRVALSAEAKGQGVEIAIDGARLGPGQVGAPLPVDPGEHAIEITAPGYARRVEAVVAQPRTVVVISVGPLAPIPAGAPIVRSGPSPVRSVGLVAGGVGAVLMVVGGVFGVRALLAASDVHARCSSSPCSDRGAIDDNEAARADARLANWGLAGGGALVVLGAALYFVGGRSEGSGPRVSAGPGAVSVQWHARF